MSTGLVPGTAADAAEIAALRNAAADTLTRRHGRGWWSGHCTAKGVRFDMRHASIWVQRERRRIVATLTLTTTKPWAIDRRYFTPVERPLYLLSMAVAPDRQRHGIGRRCLADAAVLARGWPADALLLDAYDHAAGAGEFYRKCGFRETGRALYRTVPLIYFELLFTS